VETCHQSIWSIHGLIVLATICRRRHRNFPWALQNIRLESDYWDDIGQGSAVRIRNLGFTVLYTLGLKLHDFLQNVSGFLQGRNIGKHQA